MAAYRFCRTDDIPLLVDALNRCWGPYFPDEPPMTVAGFKREIRDLQIWCSSCMVAFAGADPIGVLIGAKRSDATLVSRIAVHPDHRRQGHGRHLLTSLSSKLSILGPPRIVAEVPAGNAAAQGLFGACGFTRDACYSGFLLEASAVAPMSLQTPPGTSLVIPVTVDDLEANGLLDATDPHVCWERSVETIRARRSAIAGLAVATEERIEAYLLYSAGEILKWQSHVADPDELRLRLLLERAIGLARVPLRISKAHPDEMPISLLERLGFRRETVHTRYTGTARAA